ncbi:MAG: DUF3089 domain-containing protein [Myxococcales bacterium]|nr:DUF3089 domain-containing protein [Myxococcales bacterium]MDD9966444.1 DUF3089 domain-containing protein [Myxococcales bacterium]
MVDRIRIWEVVHAVGLACVLVACGEEASSNEEPEDTANTANPSKMMAAERAAGAGTGGDDASATAEGDQAAGDSTDDSGQSGSPNGADNDGDRAGPAASGEDNGAGAGEDSGAGADEPGASDDPDAMDDGVDDGEEPVNAFGDGSNPDAVNPYPDYRSENYARDDMWMCKPGLAHNYCIEDIVEATEALPDGSFRPFMDDLGTDHPIDCLFWYPTVNRTEDPTSLDFSDPKPMLSSIRSQAARFSRVCNVYAPFYRQVSLNNGGDRQLGFMDVVDSFKHYVANWSEGRNFVVYGHSQGTGHATRLIQQEIDDNPDLRNRLVSTLLIGGGLTADTFDNIPLCTAPDQTGCAVGFQAYGPEMSLSGIRAGLACTNPAALGGGKAVLKGAFFQSRDANYSPDLGPDFTAFWGLFRDFFTGECVEAPSGGQVLLIDYVDDPNDMRDRFLNLDREIGFGLHVFDYQFPLDDLVELVRSQRDAKLSEMP